MRLHWRKWRGFYFALACLLALLAGQATSNAIKANAQSNVCYYLDQQPSVATVEGLYGVGLNYDKLTVDHTRLLIWEQVRVFCPRHQDVLAAFDEKWSN